MECVMKVESNMTPLEWSKLDVYILIVMFSVASSIPNNSNYVSDLHTSLEPFSEKGDVDEYWN